MLESLNFHFNNISSETMGVINCKTSSGLFEEFFLPPTEIREVVTRGRETPYFQSIKRQPLSFKLTFAIESYDDDKIRSISRWLFQENYLPFYFDDFPNRIFYILFEGDSSLVHNGANSGYIELNARSFSPYTYTISATPTYTISATPTTVVLANSGDIPVKPEIEIVKSGAGNVTVENLTNNQSFTFTSLNNNETVYVNCDTEAILTDIVGTYRYSAFSGDYIQLERLNNSIQITGACTIQFRWQGKLLSSA